MKTIIFKFLAVVVAFGGAYASVRANSTLLQNPYVQYTTDNTNDPVCTLATAIIQQCNEVGTTDPCTVRVVVGTTIISSTYQGKSSGTSTCGPLLTHTSNQISAIKTFPAGTTVILQ